MLLFLANNHQKIKKTKQPMMDFFGSLRLCEIWMDIPIPIWWEVDSSIMNLNIFWTENKELPYSLGAAQWTGLIVAVLFFSPPEAIICILITRKLSWLLSQWPFCIFSTPLSMEGHISVTSQITVWKILSCFTLLQKLWIQVFWVS